MNNDQLSVVVLPGIVAPSAGEVRVRPVGAMLEQAGGSLQVVVNLSLQPGANVCLFRKSSICVYQAGNGKNTDPATGIKDASILEWSPIGVTRIRSTKEETATLDR